VLIVRRERPDDVLTVRAIQSAAFGRDGLEPMEARLLDALRADDGWLDRFSLVAELDGVVVGHNICTRAHVDGVPVLGLGPIGVRPDVQRAGVGVAMVHTMLGAADAADEPLVALLGSTDYYGRFGFVPSVDVGIVPPEPSWGPHFQVRTLAAHRPTITGTFVYAAPFTDVT